MWICNAERTGGPLSANNIMIIKTGGYTFYSLIANDKKYIIGGVPEEYKDSYIAEAEDASAIVLLTSKPEFTGGVAEVVEQNPNIGVYATSAGLRNIKEIINREVNEHLIKDNMKLDGIKFIVAPNLPWVDTTLAVYDDVLFSGELFSGDAEYYTKNLSVNREFVKSAVERVKGLGVRYISTAMGNVEDVDGTIAMYESLTQPTVNPRPLVSIIYSSEYGYTRQLAECAECELSKDYDVYFTEASRCDMSVVNRSDMLIIGTNTINRNAPKSIWNVITSLDLVNMRRTPYFVFGSFGWAGDGIKLVDKTLQAMGMKQASKPVEVLFAPDTNDFLNLEKAIAKLVQ